MTSYVAALLSIIAIILGQANAYHQEVNVLLFSVPSAQGLQKREGDFAAQTGIKANINPSRVDSPHHLLH
ncbi:hypothetical protein [Martelella limonii]|uniref:hypothetical protein n=1 Tax=Martelella limonii TaxID=1647649 RepID=UPI00157FD921|nr:hypothetical protein [Martelella limonii]